jgi:hypothetical protein
MPKNQTENSGAQQHRALNQDTSLTSWVMTHVTSWEDHRKQNYDTKWDEYYRMWRGIWKEIDKSRKSERSKIINPALSQAIEATVAELEEASFGQGKYFDVSDNFTDEDPTDIAMWRDQMEEDMDKERIPSAVSETFLNGAIYGTGIAKLLLNEVQDKKIAPKTIGDTDVETVSVVTTNTVRVGLKAIHPKEFVIDPSARTVDEALGMAHITTVPKHTVTRKQADGTYNDVTVGGYTDSIVGNPSNKDSDDLTDIRDMERTMIIEYHGLVPRELLEPVEEDNTAELFNEDLGEIKYDDTDLVEAIVTIANGTTLLRAVLNPYVMGDRCFIAYQHDTVPNMFWGRGIAEKGYNPQKALDAESRGRIDAMALSIHPMMAMDATRMQRGQDWSVAPGRNVLTNGNPKDILMPFNFGQVNPTTFSQSADLERQVQTGTGAMDSSTPIAENRRNETSSGMSMIQGGSIKRSKRTLANIERMFMKPLINKSAWRYMQFAPERYPVTDIEFNVHSTLGIMARELEQQQLAGMMQTVPAESPAFWMLLKGVYEYSSLSNREEMLGVIDQMMQTSLEKQSKPEEEDPIIAIKKQEIQVDAQMEQAKLKAKVDNDNKDLQLEVAKLELEKEKLALKREEVMLDAKIKLAEMEQDSAVTAAQMSAKFAEVQNKATTEKPAPAAAAAPAAPQVIHIDSAGAKGKTKKKVSVKRTSKGLEGTLEEVLDEVKPEVQTIKVQRTEDGLEGVVE